MARNYQEIDALVDRVYDIAVSPERLEQLIDDWNTRLNNSAGSQHFELLSEPGVLRHVERAERVLRELIRYSGEERDSAREWTDTARSAAIVVNRSGVVVAANNAARQTLWLNPGNTLSVLPVVPDDIAMLAELIEKLDDASDRDVKLLRLRKLDENAPILIQLVDSVGGDPDHVGLITSILAWPAQLSQRLKATFGLTDAETDVLKDMTLGFSVKEIAERTGRSELTIRSHVRQLLSKAGTRSQVELVRVTLGLLDSAADEPAIMPLRGPPGVSPEPNHYNSFQLEDGRKLDYLDLGDMRGRPFIMLPTDMGFTRLPPKAEAWLAANRMRMIVPVRAGYGNSSPLPRHRDAFEVAISDMLELADHLRIDRFPFLAQCDDFHLAVATACAVPGRITRIIGLGAIMPAVTALHYKRMTKWTRFIYANARYAPRVFPYIAMVFFQCARRLGPRRFMQVVMSDSKADLAVLDDNEILTAMLRGSEIAIGPNFTAHVAWTAGAISNFGTDWSHKLKACPVPMILYAGAQDPFAPIETTRDFAKAFPRILLHEFPDYGQILFPLWPTFLADVQSGLAN